MAKYTSKNILIVAGEASGDLHGANLVKAMKELDRDIQFQGIGGDKMVLAGVDIIEHSSLMAVVGVTEVLSKSFIIMKSYFRLCSILKNEKPDLLILIDYPGFNISLAGAAKKYGVPVLYYISPQLWAWRSGRVKKISERVSRMAVILPFEKDFYLNAGSPVPVEYVGHPLMDQVPRGINKGNIEREFGINNGDTVIALLPGSRNEEIKKLLPDMLGAAEIISSRVNNLRCILPVAPTISQELVNSIKKNSPLNIITTRKGVYPVLSVSEMAFVASGTATLETAIMGVPMIIVYRTSPLSFSIAKRVVKVPHIGLVNLVAGEEVAPELLQNDVKPQIIADRAFEILFDPDKKAAIKQKLERVRNTLGEPGASVKTAQIALDMMKR
ncbi:MAG: lipid-A-disaccharide synthase [Deltaproteobacteria bacterium]|nr:lipid-A-disaccharide synthase [Deltaproteobacteria bacterium]